MSLSSIAFITLICWWCCCVNNFKIFSNNANTGLFHGEIIKDFNDGSLVSLFAWIHKHSVTLVFFYAPWSGQCMKVANAVKDVHKRIDSPVLTVAAINCWVGGCRDKFPTFRFPRLFLYHSSYAPIEYLGDIETTSIMNFVQLSLLPWTYIANSHELNSFSKRKGDSFIAYMNTENIGKDKSYESFYQSTLLAINSINHPEIALITNKSLASSLSLTQHGDIRSQSSQSAGIYNTNLNYTSTAISKWMFKQMKKVVTVLDPDQDKNGYVTQLKKGPAVVLYTSFQEKENDVVQHFYDLAFSYHDCKKELPQNPLIKNACTSFLFTFGLCSVCCIYSSGDTCYSNTLQLVKTSFRNPEKDACSSFLIHSSLFVNQYSVCCQSYQKMEGKKSRHLSQKSFVLKYLQERYIDLSNVLPENGSPLNGMKSNRMILSSFLALERELDMTCMDPEVCVMGHYYLEKLNSLVRGLGCHTNRSLNFYLHDYKKYNYVFNRLAIVKDPSILIVDMDMEEHHILTHKTSFVSLAFFILKFNLGLLDQQSIKVAPELQIQRSSSIEILELTSLTFEDVVMTKENNVFVLFYTIWCGVCKSLHIQILKLAHIYGKEVIFARIDGEKHPLPYHYQASIYPSFILFPAKKKSFSVSFPSYEDITIGNLKQFLDININ